VYKRHKVSVQTTLSRVGEGRGGGGQYKKFGRLMAVSGQFQSSFAEVNGSFNR